MDRKDPRFVGAWWLGFMIIGTLIFLSSLPLFLFPKSLREKTKQSAVTSSGGLSKFQGGLTAVACTFPFLLPFSRSFLRDPDMTAGD